MEGSVLSIAAGKKEARRSMGRKMRAFLKKNKERKEKKGRKEGK